MPSPPLDLTGLPQVPGVYRFRDAAGRVMYIGRAVDLRRRVRSYWGSQRGRPRMRRMVPQIVTVEVLECDSEHEAAWLERNLLEHRKPRWNRARGGLEVPVYLRLDPRPGAPSLAVVHDAPPAPGPAAGSATPSAEHPAPGSATTSPAAPGDAPVRAARAAVAYFGPYLGGTRVRLAAAALGTIHPLAYTGPGLTGSERAMAELRGVGPGDRAAIVDALTALLAPAPSAAAHDAAVPGRHAVAVAHAREHLQTRRDRASSALEFELAARLQEQLEALEWLVSPQRVTTQKPIDGVAAGWADGLLVELRVTAGRVTTWEQRRCSQEEAAAAVADTLPGWQPFVQRSARLAASVAAAHAVVRQ